MRSKTPLALMEQLVMVLVFALAAVLCLQAFVLADRTSRRNADRDRALLEAQSAAEVLKSCRGDFARAAEDFGGEWNGQMWGWSYGEDWTRADGQGELAYHLFAAPAASDVPLLGRAEITVTTAEGDVLASLSVAWQEVESHG